MSRVASDDTTYQDEPIYTQVLPRPSDYRDERTETLTVQGAAARAGYVYADAYDADSGMSKYESVQSMRPEWHSQPYDYRPASSLYSPNTMAYNVGVENVSRENLGRGRPPADYVPPWRDTRSWSYDDRSSPGRKLTQRRNEAFAGLFADLVPMYEDKRYRAGPLFEDNDKTRSAVEPQDDFAGLGLADFMYKHRLRTKSSRSSLRSLRSLRSRLSFHKAETKAEPPKAEPALQTPALGRRQRVWNRMFGSKQAE